MTGKLHGVVNIKIKKILPLILSILTLAVVGCTTSAQTEFYRPAGSAEAPYRIGGQLDPNTGLAGEVSITINETVVIREKLPPFTNTSELSGEYAGQSVLVVLTKVRSFGSKYVRADVTIGNERAASLTF